MRVHSTLVLVYVLILGAYESASLLSSRGFAKKRHMLCMTSSPISVLVSGLPGPMARSVAECCLDRGFNLLPFSFTGLKSSKNIKQVTIEGLNRSQEVKLYPGPGLDPSSKSKLMDIKGACEQLIVVDYSTPQAVLENIHCYVDTNCDFIMGTTGEDLSIIKDILNKGTNLALISPNMAKQIVAIQSTIHDMAAKFPNSFKGYQLHVTESHQPTKLDTSGTAKALVYDICDLTNETFEIKFHEINKIRNIDDSIRFGVPKEHITQGHAFHTYRLVSPDGSVSFELKHNVCGRRVYAEGTADAISFLADVRNQGTSQEKRIYSMIDVLHASRMR